MRRLLLCALVLSTACVDDEALENTECVSADDCAPKQTCFKTGYQLANPVSFGDGSQAQLGWCRPEGEGCAIGQQPGCGCELDPNTGMAKCGGVLEPTMSVPCTCNPPPEA